VSEHAGRKNEKIQLRVEVREERKKEMYDSRESPEPFFRDLPRVGREDVFSVDVVVREEEVEGGSEIELVWRRRGDRSASRRN